MVHENLDKYVLRRRRTLTFHFLRRLAKVRKEMKNSSKVRQAFNEGGRSAACFCVWLVSRIRGVLAGNGHALGSLHLHLRFRRIGRQAK
jgi:hypothetical protein